MNKGLLRPILGDASVGIASDHGDGTTNVEHDERPGAIPGTVPAGRVELRLEVPVEALPGGGCTRIAPRPRCAVIYGPLRSGGCQRSSDNFALDATSTIMAS